MRARALLTTALAGLATATGVTAASSAPAQPGRSIPTVAAEPDGPPVDPPRGLGPVARRGERVYEQSGCAACHALGGTGNDGPGPPLDDIGARLPPQALRRVLVRPVAPMPSYRSLARRRPRSFSALVRYLRQQQGADAP